MKSWLVKIECRIIKEVICENCTEDEAQSDPWEYAKDETEIDQIDWQVLGIKENK